MEKTIEITNGPSREELFDGLRLCTEKRLVPFQVIKNEKEKYFAVIIHSIEAEDRSGQSWNLIFSVNSKYLSDEFFVEKAKKEEHVIAKKVDFNYFRQLIEEGYPIPELRKDLVRVKVYYSTKTRKGTITVPEVLCNSCDDRMGCVREQRDKAYQCPGYYYNQDE
ncbi:MAG: hypothetical protein WC908_00545 [Candidatus Paceibacterota bacterium]